MDRTASTPTILAVSLALLMMAAASTVPAGTRSVAYEQRCREDLAHCATNPGGGTYTQIAKLELGVGPIPAAGILSEVESVNSRRDCSDFRMQAFIRLLYQYGDSPLLPADVKEAVTACVLDFKYWIDEPGVDGMCYWSENHQILFHSAEYLAGQLFPEAVFSNSGMTGLEHMEKAEGLILGWMSWRERLGFSEWHSNVYYNEDIAPLINLVDFAGDGEIATRAAMLTDVLLFELALNTHDGVFGSSHGRSYGKDKKRGSDEDTACAARLLTGRGVFNSTGSMAALSMAVSPRYALPEVLLSIGETPRDVFVDREGIGIDVADGPDYGLGYDDFESGMVWWGMAGYANHQTIELTIEMADAYNLWESSFFGPFEIAKYLLPLGILPPLAEGLATFVEGPNLSRVDAYTYRTPEYMLSCAQDFNPGKWGGQQHIWQATLDQDALVFTTHPGGLPEEIEMAGHWTGGWLPRAAQHENVVVAIYRAPQIPLLLDFLVVPYTHAFFPQDDFDEVVRTGKWTLGRRGDGYLALYSQQPTRWQTEGPDAGSELIADGRGNVWICEMGSAGEYGGFDAFVEAITTAPVLPLGTAVLYRSPSQGLVMASWGGHFSVGGESIDLHGYPRFDNPYSHTPFEADRMLIEDGELSLSLDFLLGERVVVE